MYKTQKTRTSIVISLALLVCTANAADNDQKLMPKIGIKGNDYPVAEFNHSGSGYRDLEGSVINYFYPDFAGFQYVILNNKMRWRGFQEYYKGVSAEREVQASKVADGIYFLSWGGDAAGDNVVHNLNKGEVQAHLRSGGGRIVAGKDFTSIQGSLICKDTPDCVFPSDEVTPREKITPMINANAQEQGLPPLSTVTRPFTVADKAAQAELAGLAIEYRTDEGVTRVEVSGSETKVGPKFGTAKSFSTFATKIAEGIYFVSWFNGVSVGEHLMFNRNTMQAFDHILPDGTRRESIYRISCFDKADQC